jgi:putative sigma-54 modulation protein
MELLIKGKNLEVDERTQEYIRNKVNRLARHLPDPSEVKVEVAREATKSADSRYVVQVTISSHGSLLRGEERGGNVPAAMDAVVDVVNRQIERFKGRLYHSLKRTLPPEKQIAATQAQPTEEEAPQGQRKIVKIKRFRVKPMSPEEAVEEMELLSHNFFIFFNAHNERFGVVYRRTDGDYGLIEPDLA